MGFSKREKSIPLNLVAPPHFDFLITRQLLRLDPHPTSGFYFSNNSFLLLRTSIHNLSSLFRALRELNGFEFVKFLVESFRWFQNSMWKAWTIRSLNAIKDKVESFIENTLIISRRTCNYVDLIANQDPSGRILRESQRSGLICNY